MKQKYLVILTIIAMLILVGCTSNRVENIQTGDDKQLTIATTFYPLYTLTKSVVGDKATTYSIVPSGVEPHGYEPTPGDIKKLNDANVFVTLGVEFEEFEEDLVESVNPDVTVVPAGSGIELLKVEEHEDHGHKEEEHREDEHEEEGHHHHSGQDPHIWLSPKNAQKMTQNIVNGLVKADPMNKDYYEQNAQKLTKELEALDQEFKSSLASCKKEVILVNHNAFSYLGRDYNFETIEISGLEPESEPTPKQLAKLIEEAKEHNLKYVFYEELVDSRVANTIAKEVGAKVLPLVPVASDLNTGYTELMKQNLQNLEIALECQ